MTKKTIERRQFIKQAALAGATISLTPYVTSRVLGANDRVRVGIIGCGARGHERRRGQRSKTDTELRGGSHWHHLLHRSAQIDTLPNSPQFRVVNAYEPFVA